MEHSGEGKGLKALTSHQEFSQNEIIIINVPSKFRSPNEPTFQLASCLFNHKKPPEINLPATKILKNILADFSCTTESVEQNNVVEKNSSLSIEEKANSGFMDALNNPSSSLQPLTTNSLSLPFYPKIQVSDPWNRNRRLQPKIFNGFISSNNRVLTGDDFHSTRNTSEADSRPIGTLATDFRQVGYPYHKISQANYHQYHTDKRRGSFLNKSHNMQWNNAVLLPEHVYFTIFNLEHAKHLIFVNMKEIPSFFFYLRRTLPKETHLWVTYPPGFHLKGLNRNNIQSLIHQKCFHIHQLAGSSKFEAVICFPPLMYKLDENLPKAVPFTIITRKEMNKTLESLRNSGRTINVVSSFNFNIRDLYQLLGNFG